VQNAPSVKFPILARNPQWTRYNARVAHKNPCYFEGNALPTVQQELSLLKTTPVPVGKIPLFNLYNLHNFPGCSSSCSTCADSPDFCLTCRSGQVLSSGRCLSTCPSDTFSSSGSCIKCHPDCSTCSGASFDQCSSCPPTRPVLTNGRCLSTCSKSQYFDTASSTCQACDSSCSSCSGPGSQNCLACSRLTQVLRRGSCVSANCQGSIDVIPGLGVCVFELVRVPTSLSESGSPTSTLLPLGSESRPTVTGVTGPTALSVTWWQIMLVALGCVFILIVAIWCWKKEARKRREKNINSFAIAKNLEGVHDWLAQLGLRLFRNEKDLMPSEML
jgi:hypothetical protein